MMDRPDVTDQGRRTGSSDLRQTVASYESYPDAQAAVDALADDGFPVSRVAIIGSDLRLVERVTGRMNLARAAMEGGATGAILGTLVGLVYALFLIDETDAFAVIALGLAVGLALGAVWGFVAHWATHGRRDFSSVTGMVAGRYDLLADEEVAGAARERLAALTDRRPRTDAPVRRPGGDDVTAGRPDTSP